MSTIVAPRGARSAAPAVAKSRMTLDALRRGQRPAPDRILLVGTEGVGKSTFAASAPNPIFIAAEDGVRHLDVASFPEPQSFGDVLAAVATLRNDPHEFRTLVIDTVDWVEPLVWADACRRNKWFDDEGNPDIEKPGYGKGYNAAVDDWRRLVVALDGLRSARGMEIILLAHASIKTFSNPSGPDYSRYECKLAKAAAALLREWCDANLFAVHEDFVTEAKGATKSKGFSSGRRVLKTERCAAWDAKNRHGLPEELPLDYAAYAAARDEKTPIVALRREAESLIAAAAWDEARKKQALDRVAAIDDTNRMRAAIGSIRQRAADAAPETAAPAAQE